MLTPDETLHHEGVTLRRWRPDDADTLYRVVNESLDDLKPWMPWAADGYPPEAATAFLTESREQWESAKAYNYAILAEDGAIVGSCGLMARIGPGGLEVGYWLHPAYQRRGIATRAAAALTAEAFRVGADRVEIMHDVRNGRSGAIPRRLGFVEVDRRHREPSTAGETGVDVIWRKQPTGGG